MKDVTIKHKKPIYKVTAPLHEYIKVYQREVKLPISYEDLLGFTEAYPLYDKNGKDTLWETPLYNPSDMERIHNGLKKIYAYLKASGNIHIVEHKYIERIDFCTFGNTHPFRIKIVNRINDVYDYFYVKRADASRIVGLEIEHLLSPNQVNYIVDDNTLIEEHIAGIPGDVFALQYLDKPEYNPKRIAKEFVKFNERCFITLLGDMRAYNFVMQITPDFDDFQFRIRSIDFDQQFFEGNYKVYLPQFFKENYPYVKKGIEHLNETTLLQYQQEERSAIVHRVKSEKHRLVDLKNCIAQLELTTSENFNRLKQDLGNYHKNSAYSKCKHLADILNLNIKTIIKSVKYA